MRLGEADKNTLTPALSHQGRGFYLSFPQVFSGNPGSLFLVLLPLPTVGEGDKRRA